MGDMTHNNAPEVVVVGSANLDLVVEVETIPTPGETVMGGDLRRVTGGKGANQAVAAARLGRRVAMIGRVGDDDAGGALVEALAQAGVHTSGVTVTPGVPSGVALIAVGADGDNAIVVSPGANARLGAADVARHADMLRSAAVVLLQLEVPIEAVTAAARLAGGVVVLNPAPAPAAPLPAELLDRVDVIVPNQTELATLAAGLTSTSSTTGAADGAVARTTAPGESPPAAPSVDETVAAGLARLLPTRRVVVTLGEKGALVAAGGDTTLVPAPKVQPVDTTAAGDAFCGALADALVAGDDLVAAAGWAVQVGAATTLRHGAQPSLPTRAEMEQMKGDDHRFAGPRQ